MTYRFRLGFMVFLMAVCLINAVVAFRTHQLLVMTFFALAAVSFALFAVGTWIGETRKGRSDPPEGCHQS